MIKEVSASLVIFLVLTFIGVGASTLFLNPGNKLSRKIRSAAFLSLALAPALGLSVITLLAFPLYRYWTPVKVWGLGTVVFLITLSLIILILRRRSIPSWKDWPKADVLVLLLTLVIVWIGLSLIPIFGGITRVIFIYNPSDSLVYMTLSEAVRLAPWETLVSAGYVGFPNESITSLFKLLSDAVSSISGSSTESLRIDFSRLDESILTAKLIGISSTALYSARYIALPFRLATVIDLALFSQLTNIGIERLLYVFDSAISICSASACFALFRFLKVNLTWSSLGAVALILGYYNIMIFDHDAHSQVHCLPLLLLLIFIRIYTYNQTSRIFLLNVVSGSVLGSIVCAYTEFTIPIIAAFILEVSYFLVRPSFSRRRHMYDVSSIFIGSVLALTISGQLVYLLRSLIRQFTFVGNAQSAIGSTLLDGFIQENIISTTQKQLISIILGLSWLHSNFVFSPLIVLVAVGLLLAVITIFLRKNYSLLIIAIPLVSYFSISVYFLLVKEDNYSFFKVISTGSFALVLISGYFSGGSELLRKPLNLLIAKLLVVSASSFLRIFLILQIAFGCIYIFNDILFSPPEYTVRKKSNDYEFIAYQKILRKLAPQKFLVHAPPSKDWWHSAFLMISLKDFNPHFQSGYLYDNNAERLFHVALEMKGSPDYALISKSDDYLSKFAEEGKAKLVFEGLEFSIYQILDMEPRYFLYRYPQGNVSTQKSLSEKA